MIQQPQPALIQTLFASDLVKIGSFRCGLDDARFRNSGAARFNCFVFPRSAVTIQHEHEPAFTANPNVITFYNRGQVYERGPISREGDRCDWFAVDESVIRESLRGLSRETGDGAFPITRAYGDAGTYLLQRQIHTLAANASAGDTLRLEELVLALLDRVLHCAFDHRTPPIENSTRLARDAEALLSECWNEDLGLNEIARTLGASVFHLCRGFRRATGSTLHAYRNRLRTRHSLEWLDGSLVRVALDCGYCTHSHFTESFRHEFGVTPSSLRKARF